LLYYVSKQHAVTVPFPAHQRAAGKHLSEEHAVLLTVRTGGGHRWHGPTQTVAVAATHCKAAVIALLQEDKLEEILHQLERFEEFEFGLGVIPTPSAITTLARARFSIELYDEVYSLLSSIFPRRKYTQVLDGVKVYAWLEEPLPVGGISLGVLSFAPQLQPLPTEVELPLPVFGKLKEIFFGIAGRAFETWRYRKLYEHVTEIVRREFSSELAERILYREGVAEEGDPLEAAYQQICRTVLEVLDQQRLLTLRRALESDLPIEKIAKLLKEIGGFGDDTLTNLSVNELAERLKGLSKLLKPNDVGGDWDEV